MIAKDLEAEILRLYHAERWRMHTIAKQLGVHHTTVRRVILAPTADFVPSRRGNVSFPEGGRFAPFAPQEVPK